MSLTFTAPLAALTTIFTPPCSISWLLATTKVPSQYPPFPTNGPSSCDPPSWASNIADKGFQYYSPAICPSGFVVGPSCGLTTTRTAQRFPAVQNGETVAYCVPSGHTCTTDVTDFRGGVWGFTRVAATPTSGGAVATAGPALQIRWRDQDLSILETHPLTPGLLLAGATTSADETVTTDVETTNVETTTQTTTVSSLPGFLTVVVTLVTTTQLASSDRQETSQQSSLITHVVDTTSKSATGSDNGSSDPSSLPLASLAGPSSINPATVAAIVLSSALISIALASLVFVYFRRYRQKRAVQSSGFLPVGVGVWVRRGEGNEPEGFSPATVANAGRRTAQAELGGGGMVPELGQGDPIGTKENPAELDSTEALSSFRWSWMSHVSRLLGTKARPLTRSSSVTSSSAQRTRSAASERTYSSGNYSGDWEVFAKERWPDGLTVPAAVYDPPQSPRQTATTNRKSASRLILDVRPAQLNRVSGGTFGGAAQSPRSVKSSRPQ